ncbi:MAG: archease [Elusimicrobiota bacterium]
MDKEYEIIEHTADVGLKIFGRTKQDLFQNAARGMFFLITGSNTFFEQTKNRKYYKVKCEGSSLEDLLVSWLSDLLYIHNTDYVIFDDFNIKDFTEEFIQAEIRGVKIRDFPYQVELEIKAVTYHELQVFKNKKGLWEATIIFDI